MKRLSQEIQERIVAEIKDKSIPYNYDTKEYPVEVIVSKFEKDQIFVPTYQRSFVWDNNRKSRFIESVFLGVPIMPFLVSISGEEAELEVIDGSQRIRTIVDYVQNNLQLRGLKKLEQLNGTKFSQLPNYIQNVFKYRDFRFHVVTDNATTDIRADIFDRVNTSHKKLTDSEVRKGAYNSEFYRFIIDLSSNQVLRTLCPIPDSKIERGEYEELLLRFFAYSGEYQSFRHDVANFLDNYVKKQMKLPLNKAAMTTQLERMLNFVQRYFPEPYFARLAGLRMTPRVRFEAISVGVNLALEVEPNLVPRSMEWLSSEEFKYHTTTDASNNPGKLKGRVEFVRDKLLQK